MEIQLVIFLAFASVTVVTNSVLIWMIYRAFAGLTAQVTTTMRELENKDETRAVLRALEQVSAHILQSTDASRQRVLDNDNRLAAWQNRYEYQLAVVDARIRRGTEAISSKMGQLQEDLLEPTHRFHAFMSGLESVLGFLASRNGRNGR